MKSQTMRLIDVFAFAPAMLYIGYTAKNLPAWQKYFLIIGGYTTMFYNGKNYLTYRGVG